MWARTDAAIGALLEAAGGPDEFLERYAVVLCSDHGQTHVDRHVRLEDSFGDLDDVLVTASNRAGMIYRLGAAASGPTSWWWSGREPSTRRSPSGISRISSA